MRFARATAAVGVLIILVACGASTDRSATDVREPRVTAAAQAKTTKADAPPALSAKPAPDFSLRTFDGDTFTLSEHRGELPVVLNFWAPW